MRSLSKVLSSIFLAGIVVSCSHTYTEKEIKEESARIASFFEKSFQGSLDRSPGFQTYLGIKKDYDKLDDLSEEFAQREHQIQLAELSQLRDFDYDALDAQSKISYRIFEEDKKRSIESFRYRFHRYPVNQLFGIQSELPSMMINMHSVENRKEAEDYISRLGLFSRQFNQTIMNLKDRARKGIVVPKFAFEKVIRDSRNMITGAPFSTGKDSPLMADFRKKIKKLSKKDQEELLPLARKALLTSVRPGYMNLISYMQELERKAPMEGGAWSLPDGAEYYRNALKYHTTTELRAEEIHNLGNLEVRRIHGEMRQIMKKVGFKSERLKDFFEFMRKSKKFKYASNKSGRNQYLRDSKKIIGKMKGKLGELFNIEPKAKLVVQPVEKFRERSAGLAFYEGPTPDGKRPGRYYVNLSNMNAVSKYEMEALAYHEAVPGHHMQVAIASELEGIPRFRKFNWFTAYGEGWALYAERIPKELGMYQDPYSDFGRLSMELWRACRLVVDTGLHWKKWTRSQAIDYLMDSTPAAREDAVKSVERYIVMPGQATAYKIGMRKIMQLRELAKRRLGKKFDLKVFHTEILKNGAMPLNLLEEQIEAMIVREGGSAAI